MSELQTRRRLTIGAIAVASLATVLASCARPRATTLDRGEHWVATWEASPQLVEQRNLPPPGLAGSTLRQRIHLSLGGSALRLRFANTFGDGPITIAAAHVARSADSSAIDSASDRALTFGTQPSVTIPAGATATSDALAMSLPALTDLTVTIEVSAMAAAVTGHPGSRTTSYLQAGHHVGERSLPNAVAVAHWYVISGADVIAAKSSAAIVTLGNSITDGRGSGTDRNDRWPDDLARRLQSDPRTKDVAVVNAGIGGNAVVRGGLGPTALARLDRDAIDQPSARWIIVLEGVNDIGIAAPDSAANVADTLIAAYRQIITRAHAHGLKVYGATILPFGGSFYDAPQRELARQAVNRWIRVSHAFDAIIDFDAAMRDPDQPSHLRTIADGGDHLHPNAVGYQMMADAIDLGLFAH